MNCIKNGKLVENLWNSYLLFRCCILVIPIYILLIIIGTIVLSNNIEIPSIIRTIYEFCLLVFSAAIIFIIVLILATFGSNYNKVSTNSYEYENQMIESNNPIESDFDELELIDVENNLLTQLESTTDQIQLFFDNCDHFVIDLVPLEDTSQANQFKRQYDCPPSYEEAVRTANKLKT